MAAGDTFRFGQRILILIKLFIAVAFWVGCAHAHLMPVQEGFLKINRNEVLITLSIPVSSLKSLGNTQPGLINRNELELRRQEISSEIKERLTFSAQTRKYLIVYFNLMLSPVNNDNSGEADQLIIYEKLLFTGSENIEHLTMSCDLFGFQQTEKSFSIKATRQGVSDSDFESESAVFDVLNESREFFKPLPSLFVDYLSLGIEHILSGFDHLLFILTVLVAGYGMRYWVSIITVFSVAHSITLAATLFALISISPVIVEPSIAASIVIMALGNMSFMNTLKHKYVYLIIFICGLLHGMGFASAINLEGFNVSTKIITLVGFNLGIEFGQIVFLFTALALIALINRLFTKINNLNIKTFVSLTAGLCGGILLIQRIVFYAQSN